MSEIWVAKPELIEASVEFGSGSETVQLSSLN